LHPVKELSVEGNYLDARSNHMMEKHAEFDKLVEDATGRDWSAEAEKLNTIIGGGQFYSKAYNPDTGTSWGKVQNTFYSSLAYFIGPDSTVDLYKLDLDECRAVLRGETNSFDPSGSLALQTADEETSLWLYVGSFIIILIIFILSFYFKIIGFSKTGWRK
jgi:hypothetical protein